MSEIEQTKELDQRFGVAARTRAHLSSSIGKRIGFLVPGDTPAYWELDLARGEHAKVVRMEPAERPDVCVTIRADFMTTFLGETFSGLHACRARKLRIQGCAQTFRRFLLMLNPPKKGTGRCGGEFAPRKASGVNLGNTISRRSTSVHARDKVRGRI